MKEPAGGQDLFFIAQVSFTTEVDRWHSMDKTERQS